MWPEDREGQEAYLRKLVESGAEFPKLDFKTDFEIETADGRGKLLKDINAISNTVDYTEGGFGYLIFGAARGRLIGDVNALEETNIDNLSASLSQLIKNHMYPQPSFGLYSFRDADKGWWGALVIKPFPHERGPSIFTRMASSNKKTYATIGQWFIRHGDTNGEPSVFDYNAYISIRVQSALKPFQNEIQDLNSRVAVLESKISQMNEMAKPSLKIDVSPQEFKARSERVVEKEIKDEYNPLIVSLYKRLVQEKPGEPYQPPMLRVGGTSYIEIPDVTGRVENFEVPLSSIKRVEKYLADEKIAQSSSELVFFGLKKRYDQLAMPGNFQVLGETASKYKLFCQIEDYLDEMMYYIRIKKALLNVHRIEVKLINLGSVAVKNIKMDIRGEDDLRLLDFVPDIEKYDSSRQAGISRTLTDRIVKQRYNIEEEDLIKCSIDLLSPGEERVVKLGLKGTKSGGVYIRMTAENISSPHSEGFVIKIT